MTIKRSLKSKGKLGTLKERMRYTLDCLGKIDSMNFDNDLWNAIHDMDTLVRDMPDDWAFDKKTDKIVRVTTIAR